MQKNYEPILNTTPCFPIVSDAKSVGGREEFLCNLPKARLPRKSPWYVLNLHNRKFKTVIRLVRAQFGHRHVFAPKCNDLIVVRGQRVRKMRTYLLPDLLFVQAGETDLEAFRTAVAAETNASPFAFYRDRCSGDEYKRMTVSWEEMRNFIHTYEVKDRCPQIHSFAELNAPGGLLVNADQKIRILNGPLKGTIGHYARHTSTKRKCLCILLKNMIVLEVAMTPDDLFEVLPE